MVNNQNQSHQSQSQQTHDWQVVLRQPNGKVVLYHSHSKQLSLHHQTHYYQQQQQENQNQNVLAGTDLISNRITHCPLCLQPFNLRPLHPNPTPESSKPQSTSIHRSPTHFLYRSALPQPPSDSKSRTVTQPSYFDLLSQTNTPFASQSITPIESSSPRCSRTSSVSSLDSPGLHHSPSDPDPIEPLGQDKRVDGYYERFFIEVMNLGRGQKGSVFLCTHTLDGNPLGHYAVKKIAIGQSSPELLHVLSEVKFLESLRHPNIAQYHHAWIEKAQLSRFGPKVPVLYILMDFANGGTLDDYIALRKGSKSTETKSFPNPEADEELQKRARQKERFRQMKTRKTEGFSSSLLSSWKLGDHPLEFKNPDKSFDRAVHLFGLEEILSVFEDTCCGLDFLHSKGILHHDLKTENVLLHWESEDAMMPTAMISDFGSSISQSENWSRERTGRTGTLDWVPPESLKKDPKTGRLFEVTQKGDLWQLGLLLHSLCFFRLPYTHSDDIDLLKDEIIKYPGFMIDENLDELGKFHARMNSPEVQHFSRSDLPRALIQILADLLCLEPRLRPSCEQVLRDLEKIRAANEDTMRRSGVPKHPKRPHHGTHTTGAGLVSKRTRVSQEAGMARSTSLNARHLSLVQRRKSSSETDSNAKDNRHRLLVIPGSSHRAKPTADHAHHPSTTAGEHRSPALHRVFSPWSLVSSPVDRHDSGRPLSQRAIARWIGACICLKSLFFIRVVHLSSPFLGRASALPSAPTPPPSLSVDYQAGFMLLIVFNTLESLVGEMRFSIGLTVFECLIVYLLG